MRDPGDHGCCCRGALEYLSPPPEDEIRRNDQAPSLVEARNDRHPAVQ